MILVTGVGSVDPGALKSIKEGLEGVFESEVRLAGGLPEPVYAYNPLRGQYLAASILEALKGVDVRGGAKVLGVVDRDLYAGGLNFVFGQAGRNTAVIALPRLKEGPKGPGGGGAGKGLFSRRALTEAVHELGHTFGLAHCPEPECAMHFSLSLADTDRKGPAFCPRCSKLLEPDAAN